MATSVEIHDEVMQTYPNGCVKGSTHRLVQFSLGKEMRKIFILPRSPQHIGLVFCGASVYNIRTVAAAIMLTNEPFYGLTLFLNVRRI
jgi:hypothetical protein